MNHYSHTQISKTAKLIPVLCGLIFLCYSFVFIYHSQSSVLSLAQRIASPDSPAFHPLFSAIFCSLLLWLLGLLLCRLFSWLPLRLKALPWFIPFLGVGILTHWHFLQFGDTQSSGSIAFYIFIGFVFLALIFIGITVKDSQNENGSVYSYYWNNLLLMIFFMAVSLRICNTDRMIHQTLETDRLLFGKDYNGVIEYCKKCPRLSRSQNVMLSIALYKENQLGEHLFDYPQQSGSEGLIAQPCDSVLLSNPHELQGHLLGYRRGQHISASDFLQVLPSYRNAKIASIVYRLCDLLIKKNLDKFVYLLTETNDSLTTKLPNHYREAIILYQYIKNNPSTHLEDDATESNFIDFMELKKGGTKQSQAMNCRDMFGTTYWYYYYFE